MKRILIMSTILGCLFLAGCGWGYRQQSHRISHMEKRFERFSEYSDNKMAKNMEEIRKLRARVEGMYLGSIESLASIQSILHGFSKQLQAVEQKTASAEEKTQLLHAAIREFEHEFHNRFKKLVSQNSRTEELISKLPHVGFCYKVGGNERITLSELSRKFDVPLWPLLLENGYKPDEIIQNNDIIVISDPIWSGGEFQKDRESGVDNPFVEIYIKKYIFIGDDSIEKIANKFGVNVKTLLRWNQIGSSGVVPEGTIMKVPQIM